MTERHAQIADFVRSYTGARGFPPSYKEIAEHLGITSQSTVFKHIGAMEDLGIVRTSITELGKRKVRSIEVIHRQVPGCSRCKVLEQELAEANAIIERMLKRREAYGE